jgi:hypothetical protein
MTRHVLTVLVRFVAAVVSGAVFTAALFRQFTLVEAAASILRSFFPEFVDRRAAR